MPYRPAIKTSRLAILNYYLTEAAKSNEEWSCERDRSSDREQAAPEKEMVLLQAIDRYDGRGEPPAGWVKTTYPSIVQKIGRKLDAKKPQCFACHIVFES